MLKIKLLRKGKKNQAYFRVVVIDARKARDSKFIEDLGYLNPHANPADFHIDEKLAKEWLAKGAQPTETVSHYFFKLKLLKSIKHGSTKPAKAPKKKAKPEEKAPQTPQAPVEAAKPVDEVKPTEATTVEAKPAEVATPAEEPAKVEETKATEDVKPTEEVKPIEEVKPVEEPAKTEETKKE